MLRTAYDFIITGAGPAGTVTAARLAGAGARVALIDRSHPVTIKAGEFLTPSTKAFVDANGLLPPGWQQGHLPVHAFLNGWGVAEPAHVDFIADPYGFALALDRPLFERQLIDAARAQGADVFLDSKIAPMDFERSRWLLGLGLEQRTVYLTAGKLVLATGRHSRPPSAVRRQRLILDRHAFLAASWQASGCDLLPCLESGEDCWSYVTPAPGGTAVFYVFFDPASCASPPVRSVRWLATMLEGCSYASAALAQVERRGSGDPVWLGGRASSTMTRPVFGPGWCAVGDAAQCYDPLSSQGLSQALQSAVAMATLLQDSGAGPGGNDAAALQEERNESYLRYLHERQVHYAAERRWSELPFWKGNVFRNAGDTARAWRSRLSEHSAVVEK